MRACGHAPTPTPILEARGSPLSAGRRAEPRPRKVPPTAPEWLEAEARALVEADLLHFKSRRVSPPISAFLAQVFS